MAMRNAALDPGFFDGRYLVEILSWDWNLHVGMASKYTPKKYRFQGGLAYTRGVTIEGRIQAPEKDRGSTITVLVSPFGPELKFGGKHLDGVGIWYTNAPELQPRDYHASLFLPEDALPGFLTCLASIWRYAHIWTAGDDGERASITGFSFSRDLHENIAPWAFGATEQSAV